MNLRQSNHWNDGLDKRILESLQNMMDRVSPYVATYRSMKEKMSELLPEANTVIAETEGYDTRRYNKPRQYEPDVVTNANMWIHWHIHCCSLVVSLVGTRN